MSIIIVIASPTSGSYKLNNFTWGVAVSLSGYAMTGILKYIEFLIDAFNTGLSDHFISVLGDCHVRQVDSLGCCYHEGGLAMTIWMSIRHPIIRHSPSVLPRSLQFRSDKQDQLILLLLSYSYKA